MVKSHRLGTETVDNRVKRSGDDILDVQVAAKPENVRQQREE